VVAALNLAAHTSMISLEEMEIRFLPDLLATADKIAAQVKFRQEDEMTQ
jgi:DNA-binding IclR family transcriptional regulator